MSSFTKLLTMRSALVASVLFLAAHVPTTAAYDEVYNGCYSSSTPLEDQGSYTYQSNGYCQKLCLKDNYAVFALHNKQDCLCGNELPASSDKVSDDECNLSCAGWPSVMCGGANTYSVYLTGIEDDVDNYSSSSSTSSKSTEGTSTSTTQTPTVHAVTSGGQTVYVTEAPATHAANASATPTEKSKSSSANTAAIAAGVVIGVVGLCALIGAGFFLWRFKNRKSVEAQYRRSVGVDGYGQPMAQGSDSRFDGDFMAQKRQSNGSIDDDQDFSRRILQVTNPDRR